MHTAVQEPQTHRQSQAVLVEVRLQNKNGVETATRLNVSQDFIDRNLIVWKQQIDTNSKHFQLLLNALSIVSEIKN